MTANRNNHPERRLGFGARGALTALLVVGCSPVEPAGSTQQSIYDGNPEDLSFICPFPENGLGTRFVYRNFWKSDKIIYHCNGVESELHWSFLGHRRWTTDQLGISLSSLLAPSCKLTVRFSGDEGSLRLEILEGPNKRQELVECTERMTP